jgi:hypothetical protein
MPPALLVTGCVEQAWTPTPSAAAWVGPLPESIQVQLPTRADAIRRWQLPAGDPWAPYAKYTLLTALDASAEVAVLPDPTRLEQVQDAVRAGQQLGSEGLPPNTLWIIDLRGAASVAFGVALSRTSRQPVSLVPTFNNWPGDDEMIPAEETLAALTMMSPRRAAVPAEVSEGATPVFLLDAWRLAYKVEDPGDETYDNRYILNPGDLPDVAKLRAQGIDQVVYVVTSEYATLFEEDDLHVPFLEWQRQGMPIAMMDVEHLAIPISPDAWQERFALDALVVKDRVTLLDEPWFYVGARGGFGGIYAHPSPLLHGGWHGGGHGGGGWHGGGG